MENEEAKFVLINGITIEQYIDNKVQEKLEQIVNKINNNFLCHSHNITTTNHYGNQVTISISPSTDIMKIEKGIDY